jgi:hypothetical protein
MSIQANLSFRVDVNDLIRQVTRATERASLNDRMIDGGNGRWISSQTGGLLISACFHNTRKHSATARVNGNIIKRSASSSAEAGRWAIAYVQSGKLGGDETFYNLD